MTTDRFHKAAKDGLSDVLREATKRECNGKDEQGLTPTLYAAFYGHLDALRLLCGRGGDPDKQDIFGNTAMHLSAAQGHMKIVTFLTNFGANIFAMDIDQRSPQDVAGVNGREEILRFLDGFTAKLEATDKKKTKSMKDKAKKDWEKIIKEYNKHQEKVDKSQKKGTQIKKSSLISTIRVKLQKSGSMSNLKEIGNTVPRNSFSVLTMPKPSVGGTVQRKALLANRTKKLHNSMLMDDEFKISEIEDGKRSVRAIKGFRNGSEILYSGTLDSSRNGGKLAGMFDEEAEDQHAGLNGIAQDTDGEGDRMDGISSVGRTAGGYNGTQRGLNGLTRSVSQPDFMQELNNNNNDGVLHEPSSFFVRPGVGSLTFGKSISNTYRHIEAAREAATEESSIGSAGSLAVRQPFQMSDYDMSDPEYSDDENDKSSPIERFLTAFGLGEYLSKFEEQKIDLETLLLLNENDLRTLNLPLGPYKRLVIAVAERKNALENPGEVTDSML